MILKKGESIKVIKLSFLWCLLFGVFYFAYHGCWFVALAALILSALTGGIAWLIFPFLARSIVISRYIKDGWEESVAFQY